MERKNKDKNKWVSRRVHFLYSLQEYFHLPLSGQLENSVRSLFPCFAVMKRHLCYFQLTLSETFLLMDYQSPGTVTKQQHASFPNNTNPELFHNSDFRERVQFQSCVFAKTCKRAITAWSCCQLRNRATESCDTRSIQTAIISMQKFIQMKVWLPGQTRAGDLKVKSFGVHRNVHLPAAPIKHISD